MLNFVAIYKSNYTTKHYRFLNCYFQDLLLLLSLPFAKLSALKMGSLRSWEPGKPRIFQKGYKEPTEVSLIGDNQIGNPQNEIPNDDPE